MTSGRISRKKEEELIGILRRNFLYQTPTPVLEGDRAVRFNITIFADDYVTMMKIADEAGGFVMPREDQIVLAQQFADKAKTASGEYDLSAWSMGDLAAAIDDVKGMPELTEFCEALGLEVKKRTAAEG